MAVIDLSLKLQSTTTETTLSETVDPPLGDASEATDLGWEKPQPEWTPLRAVGMFVLWMVAELLVTIVVLRAMSVAGVRIGVPLTLWMTPVAMIGGFVGALLVLYSQRNLAGAKPLWSSKELLNWRTWGLVLLAIGLSLLAGLLYNPAIDRPGIDNGLASLKDYVGGTKWALIGLYAVAISILAPIAEEWLFRGILLPAFSRQWGVLIGVLCSALLFGLAHGILVLMPLYAAFGLCWGWLGHNRPTLTFSIVTHAAWNLMILTRYLVL